MNGDNINNDDKAFLLHLHMRAERKAEDYTELLHQKQVLERRIEQTKEYIEQLNNFLRAEGMDSVQIKAAPTYGVGKPGNRSKKMPPRKMRWEGMSVNEIIESTLNASPDVYFYATEIASVIYDIQSKTDEKAVIRNVRSTLQKGAREGRWGKIGRGKFKAKETMTQGVLVND